jgi:uncharacterized protein with GYD domain
MNTYILFGKMSVNAVRDISSVRTMKSITIVEKYGGQIQAIYALLGGADVLAIIDFPGTNEAMKASIELTKLLGIAFSTSLAMAIDEFDKLAEKQS